MSFAGELRDSTACQHGSSGSLSQLLIPGVEALPLIDGSQVTPQLSDNCCYFHHPCACREKQLPSSINLGADKQVIFSREQYRARECLDQRVASLE